MQKFTYKQLGLDIPTTNGAIEDGWVSIPTPVEKEKKKSWFSFKQKKQQPPKEETKVEEDD